MYVRKNLCMYINSNVYCFKSLILIIKMLFKCEFCNNEYTTKSSLNRHKKTVKKCFNLSENTDNTEYKCNNCDYNTKLKSNLNKHEKICKLKNIKKNI